MKQLSTRAIILKRISFGEADRILTVITPDYGKVSLLAKGVRRSKSKLAGGLELFSVSSITYIDGRSELKTVVSTQLLKHFGGVVKDIKTTMIYTHVTNGSITNVASPLDSLRLSIKKP